MLYLSERIECSLVKYDRSEQISLAMYSSIQYSPESCIIGFYLIALSFSLPIRALFIHVRSLHKVLGLDHGWIIEDERNCWDFLNGAAPESDGMIWPAVASSEV